MSDESAIVFAIPTRNERALGGDLGPVPVEVSARDRATPRVKREAIPGRDVVRLEFVNGPELWLHPECARDLFAAQQPTPDSKPTDGVQVPTRLSWRQPSLPDQSRGGGGNDVAQIVLRAFEVIRETVSSQGANVIAGAAGRLLDRRVAQGLRRLTEALPDLTQPTATPAGNRPILVLIHGTCSTTLETFKHLWEHPGLVGGLLARFDVYGFDHPTLETSPIQNAVDLVAALPEGANVSFLTHSRGGLVAEVIAQLASGEETELRAFDAPQYQAQRAEIERLREVLAQRKPKVTRIVRVACPARGTLLASRRLDVYLSVLKWGLQLAQVPVAKELSGFLLEVAQRRTKPEEFPGLEAMMPESAFIEWLHQSDREIEGELRVVAGDLQGDSIASWLKTLASEAFFWTDNDLIVQTRSMYGGRPRQAGSSYFLERSGNVTHFGYFANRVTVQAIARAVTEDKPAEFRPIGRLSAAGVSATGSRGGGDDIATVIAASKALAKPALIVLPGILGSHLKVNGERVWLSLRIVNGLKRLEYDKHTVEPDGWMAPFYDSLIRYLADSHEVIPFAFDWRKPIEEEAKRLGGVLREALKDRTEPVRIIAHSLGGLVARAVEKVEPDVWAAFLKHERSRLLMLGTPHTGSWAPMQVLSGDNLLGNLLALVGTLFQEDEARKLFAGLPGFLQLQAGLLDDGLRLGERKTWEELQKLDRARWEQLPLWHSRELMWRATEWGIPGQGVLDTASELQRFFAAQDLRRYGDRILNVVGTADRTPSGFERTENPNGFEYLQTDRGDGTVPLASALLPGVRAFQVDVEHSKLALTSELHAGYLNLLEKGTPDDARNFTSLFLTRGGTTSPVAARSERAPRRASMRGWSDDALDAIEGPLTLPSADLKPTRYGSVPSLKIAVVNGDLTFVKEPLMLGHYRSASLTTGAEGVIDRFLKGTMSQALRLRRYPTLPRESDVFDNEQPNPDDPRALPRPAGVVVVGLGAEGELHAEELIATVRQGVIAYAQRLAGKPAPPSNFELASTLIGSGGIGVTVATSAHAVAQGVRAANERLLVEGWPIVSKLYFIELYEDRAAEALRELLAAAEQKPAAFDVLPVLEVGTSPLPRPETPSYRGAEYDIVSALSGPSQDGHNTILFTIDTQRARTEVRSATTQLRLLQDLILDAQGDRRADSTLGKTLFRILVPGELDSFFGNSEAVQLEVDDATAGVPWEVLTVDSEEDQPSDKPWSIRVKLVRKLKTPDFRENPQSAGLVAQMLVLGDPACDDRVRYPSLAGAKREAEAVARALSGSRLHVNKTAREIVDALLGEHYSIVHIAGHGAEDGSGVVLSGGQVLGALLVRSMRRLPDLVFVNCCHSGRQAVGNLPQRAATLAGALIRAGVRCVIATGWAVDDEAAEHFAAEFYRGLLSGRQSFMDATSAARESTWRHFPHSNTWAAYQCYGDPDWVWNRDDVFAAVGQQSSTSLEVRREAPIVSAAGLLVALKTLATRRRSDSKSRLLGLETQYASRFGHLGNVAEAFGNTYRDLGERLDAIRWYERAVVSEGGATFGALEQLCNLGVRYAEEQVEVAYAQWEIDRDEQAFARAAADAHAVLRPREDDLEMLAKLHATYERTNLLASAWKRRAMTAYATSVVLKSSDAHAATKLALERSRDLYSQAAELAKARGLVEIGYARVNEMTARLVLDWVAGRTPAVDEAAVAAVREELVAWRDKKPEFWPFAQLIELDIYVALCRGALEPTLTSTEAAFTELWERMANPRQWASIRDQARLTLRPYELINHSNQKEAKAAVKLRGLIEGYARVGS